MNDRHADHKLENKTTSRHKHTNKTNKQQNFISVQKRNDRYTVTASALTAQPVTETEVRVLIMRLKDDLLKLLEQRQR